MLLGTGRMPIKRQQFFFNWISFWAVLPYSWFIVVIADYRAWPALLICFRWSLLFPLFSFFVPAHILWCVLSPSSNRCSHREIETSHATVDSLLHFQTDQDLLFEVTSVCASVTSFVKALHRSVGTEKNLWILHWSFCGVHRTFLWMCTSLVTCFAARAVAHDWHLQAVVFDVFANYGVFQFFT